MIEVRVLGSFQSFDEESTRLKFETTSARALFAYLLLQPETDHPRSSLSDLLWPELDESTARTNLRNTLSRVRKAIGEKADSPIYLDITRESIRIHPGAPISLDAQEFIRLVDEQKEHAHRRLEACTRCLKLLEAACEIYRGDLLSGLNLDSLSFEEWIRIHREMFRIRIHNVYLLLADIYLARGRFQDAIAIAMRHIGLDPWQEQAHRQLMQAHALNGDTVKAIAVYRNLRNLLKTDLDVEPSSRSRAMLDQIQAGDLDVLKPGPPLIRLPGTYSGFYGREVEQQHLSEMLENPANHLVTIRGAGGIGKTRLAISVALQAAPSFMNGVCFLPLDSIEAGTSSESLVSALSLALDFSAPGAGDLKEALFSFLENKEILIVLDNAEHLTDVLQDFVLSLIESAPRCALLVTSREPLFLRPERVYPLRGLPVEDGPVSNNPVDFGPGVQMFFARAERAGAALIADTKSLSAVIEICRYVEGYPLAIELAAAQTTSRSPAEILSEIKVTSRMLTMPLADIPGRHLSMRAVFENSWQHLDGAEEKGLMTAAIFVDGIRHAAAVEILDRLIGEKKKENTSAAVMHSLVEKSLLEFRHEDRYALHPFLGEFADSKLRRVPHLRLRIEALHASFFVEFLIGRTGTTGNSDSTDNFKDMLLDKRNIQKAVYRTVQLGELDRIPVALRCLYLVYEQLNLFQEGVEVFGTIVNFLNDREIESTARILRARALGFLGVFQRRTGRLKDARNKLDESVEILRSEQDDFGQAFSLASLGLVHEILGNLEEAQRVAAEGLALAKKTGDAWLISRALASLGSVCEARRDYPKAKELFEAGLAINRSLDDRREMAISMNNLGIVNEMLGDTLAAAELYRESRLHFTELGDRWGNVIVLGNLGDLAAADGRPNEARASYFEALETSQAIHAITQGLTLTLKLASLFVEINEIERARLLLSLLIRHPAADGQLKDLAIEKLSGILVQDPQVLQEYLSMPDGHAVDLQDLISVVCAHDNQVPIEAIQGTETDRPPGG